MFKKVGIVVLLLGVIWSCNRAEYKCEDCIIQYASSDPKQLTPFNATDETATVIFNHIFQTLINFDYQTNEIIPVLAKEKPSISTTKEGKVAAQFEIHESAVWNDGLPITGKDVAFSLKVIKCPFTDNHHLKPGFEIIERIDIDKDYPKRFKVVFKESTMMLESIFTDLYILPKHVYDSNDLLGEYSVYEFSYKSEAELQDDRLIQFGENYNSPKFQRDVIEGSGAYRVVSWDSNERIVLKRKERWWGFNLSNLNQWFQANMKELVFEIYNDNPKAAYKMLKRERIHAMNDVPVEDFATNWYPKSSKYHEDYHILTAPTFSYDYIGLNMESPKLNDITVRKALAHLIDIDKLINETCFGFADRVISFTHPSLEDLNKDGLEPYVHDLTMADSLLTLAGWQDLDSNGIREKTLLIDSIEQTVSLSLRINYNIGNERRKAVCELLQKAAAKIGVEIVIESLELVSLLEQLKTHQFELYVGGWLASPKLADPKILWHTESANGGSNYVHFGNNKSDAIVDAIRTEMNPKKRAKLYRELHQMIHDDIPYIFLISQQKRIVVNKRFQNVYGSGIQPGYWSQGFKHRL